MKFNIKWKYGYNDCGANFIIDAYKIDEGYDDEFIDSESVEIRGGTHYPKIGGWKKALSEAVRDNPNMRGAITAIKNESKNPYYCGSENPHWMR